MTRTTRILIADDHGVVREGLRRVLEAQPSCTICGEAATGREAVAKAKALRPDVVVLDIAMPELNGLDAARLIRRMLPATEVLILTMHDSEALAREALAAGARGFVLKTDAAEVLGNAVANLSRHQPYLTATATSLVLDGFLNPDHAGSGNTRRDRLTAREREIVLLLAEGRTNKEIAAALGISVNTCETHRYNIMRKLNLRSLSELVRYAIREHIIEP
ncbi:response regulator transcription factor [bacterium]|nr:response regulator transcription factor [bacterium]